MTLIGFILYTIANIVGLYLFWSYKKRDKKKKQSAAEPLQIELTRKRRLKHYQSLFAILGISDQDKSFHTIENHFHSCLEVGNAFKRVGLKKCGLIIGVDFTASNERQGRTTFNNQCLHKIISGKIYNPYQKVISIIGQTLAPFVDDNLIPAYGFGDLSTKDDVFCFHANGAACRGFSEVLNKYNEYATKLNLSGPTNFEPVINKAVEIVKLRKSYHILIIIADGQVTEENRTIQAIVRASNFPLSIVVIGVGDGPWNIMEDYDNFLPNRIFDNFQFVNYQTTSKKKNPATHLALNVLMEIPQQYKIIKALKYLDGDDTASNSRVKT